MSRAQNLPDTFITGKGRKIDLKKQGTFIESDQLTGELKEQYLKNIIEFEESYANAVEVTILERIGNPVFLPIEALEPGDMPGEIQRFNNLLKSNSLELHFCQGPYPDEMIYRYITEEFLQHKIDDVRVNGMITGFIFEEFHPNHEADIRALVKDFFKGWFKAGFKEHTFLFTQKGRHGEMAVSKKALMKNINNFFMAFKRFEKCDHRIVKTSWQLPASINENQYDEGSGLVEGWMCYDGVIENNEFIHFEGNYRLELVRTYGSWLIDSFVVPGFNNKVKHGP